MMSILYLTFVVGLALIIVAIVGGGLEIKEVRIPTLPIVPRAMSFLLGCALLAICTLDPGILPGGTDASPSTTPSSGSSTAHAHSTTTSVRGAGGPLVFTPPPGRGQWVVEKSTVYLEPTGDKRQFFLIEPSLELTGQDVQSGSLLFDGQKNDTSYEGKLFIFAGRCGTREYDASGPITNDGQTVTLVGAAPLIDPETCLKVGERERTLVFNYKRRID
jgi:hypothetical protein